VRSSRDRDRADAAVARPRCPGLRQLDALGTLLRTRLKAGVADADQAAEYVGAAD
jgi:hypothetical protein